MTTTPDPPVEPPLAEITTNPETPATTEPASTPVPAVTVAPVPAQTLVLDLDVKDPSWVKITTDGNVVLNKNLTAGSTHRFTATSSIGVSIGNAGGTSVRINGREIPALGETGNVREFTITPENAARIR
jgi:hypothetical protein